MASIARVWLTYFYALFHKLMSVQRPKTNSLRGANLVTSDRNKNSRALEVWHSMQLHMRHHPSIVLKLWTTRDWSCCCSSSILKLINYFDSLQFLQMLIVASDIPFINDITYNKLVKIVYKAHSLLLKEG